MAFAKMTPPDEVIKSHLHHTARTISKHSIPCLLCGDRGRIPGVWIISDEMAAELNLPFNRFRTIGYALCSKCCLIEQEELFDQVEDVLIDTLMENDLFTPQVFPPAIFMN